MNNKYIGQNIPFKDADQKMLSSFKYVSDLKMSDMLHLEILTSEVPHGEIKSIDVSQAKNVKGVEKIYTHSNTPDRKFHSYHWYKGQELHGDEVLLSSKARHVGDRIAAVAAENEDSAVKASNLIEVEYKELNPIIDPLEAMKKENEIHSEQENPFAERNIGYGSPAKTIEEAEEDPDKFVFNSRVDTPKVHHAALENHSCVAYPEGAGSKVVVVSPCQLLFGVRLVISDVLDLPLNKIRVIKGNMGGSFGGKQEIFLEPLAAFVALDLQRPVKISFNREQSILSTRTRSKTIGEVKTAVNSEGKIMARDIQVVVDAGGYTSNGDIVSAAMAKKISRLYKIPHQSYRSYSVHTNTPVGGPCRGYGSPQIHAITEINFDKTARGINMDRVEFRKKNLLKPYEEDPLGGPNIGNARIIKALEVGEEKFAWNKKKSEMKKNDSGARFKSGIGTACATHVNGYYDVYPDYTSMNLGFNEDGSLILKSSVHELGAGAKTMLAQIIGEILDIDPHLIEVPEGDTDQTPYDIGCHASRSTFVMGRAAKETAEKLCEIVKKETAGYFNVDIKKVELAEGKIKIAGDSFAYSEIIPKIMHENQVEMAVSNTYSSSSNPGSYGAHFCQVEVDTLTGLVEIADYVAVHDVGRAINPRAVKTQIEGGVQMGVGMALLEEINFDRDGYPQCQNFDEYHIINAVEMPEVKTYLIEEAESEGPFGAKSIGEIATVPVAAAVVNAVNDALNLYLTDLPLTPSKISRAVNENQH